MKRVIGMDIFDYVEKYGNYSLEDIEFNEVDNLVFSSLSYINFLNIVSSNSIGKITIKEASDKYFSLYPEDGNCILGVKYARRLLRIVKDSKRYGDLLLYNYVYEYRDDQQFGALTIELNKDLVYVSFEGTDQLVGGWREDFMLSYKFPVLSQRRAIDYVNKNFLFRRKNIILGGHSKGGNLAMVAGMYANFLVRDKIVAIYNNDGPGLLKEQYESKFYKYIEKKIIHIVPSYSVVGLLLSHGDNINVVRSFRKSIVSHMPYTWVVNDKGFEKCELSSFSSSLDKEIDNWLNNYSVEDRKRLINNLFGIFDKVGIDSLVDLIENKRLLLKLINESKELDEDTSLMIKSFVKILLESFKISAKEEVLSLFDKKK